jgi:predicted O-methyltransferase YrrM
LFKGRWDMVASMTTAVAKDIYMPISAQQGQFMYQTARAIGAKTVVEFGTSFGISTIYLASAVMDNGGELVIGSELEPNKHGHATENLAEAGLAHFTDIRLGDALVTLRETPYPIDLVFLDGWKDLYLPILHMLEPRLRIGSVVFADDINLFKRTLKPYVEYVQSSENGFVSTTLPIGDGLEYSVYVGRREVTGQPQKTNGKVHWRLIPEFARAMWPLGRSATD